MLNSVLMLLAGVGIGGTVGVFAMAMAAASKVEPPSPLAREIKMTVNRQKAEETSNNDEE